MRLPPSPTDAAPGVRIWDLPTRVFHWLLVAAVGAAWFTGETGGNLLVWHGRIGLFILGLLVFRLVWGLVGSTYARFTSFVRGPAAIAAYLRGGWDGLGHNPLGALSVLGLLGLGLFQATSGLFAYNDDIGYQGPLNALISSRAGELVTGLHHESFDVLLVLVALHVAAIMFYTVVRKDNLVRPMLTGRKPGAVGRPATGGGILAFLLALAVACAVVWAASGVWLPPPPPPAAAPGW